MRKYVRYFLLCAFLFLLFNSTLLHAADFEYIDKLFDLRTSITDQGRLLPEAIKVAKANNLRILERVFELNTSALTTIEAYFRIFKISITTGTTLNESTTKILNEWLSFIENQCKYDSDYLTAAQTETDNPDVLKHLKISKVNIVKLAELCEEGVTENSRVLAKNAAPVKTPEAAGEKTAPADLPKNAPAAASN
ncbi:MAG: hypothetical protein HQL28_05655 [Candidatus Omnitrophica bacterium]|nr:hypothetical protein [Candidatus Omnitrophota bacterium]